MSKKGEETKKMILEEAKCLFARKGFKDVSMSDICKSTGLSRGGLYRHYSSTSEIFQSLIGTDYSFEEQIERNESAIKILEDELDFLEKEIIQNESSLSLAIYEYANIRDNREMFLEMETKAKKRWMQLIEYGIVTGKFQSVNSEAAAEMILYYYQGLRMWSRIANIGENAANNYKSIIISMLTGVK
ncbi:MAG: TetR/AcrR family transcriptional regulator [Lachnospiraceae bacterium]|nr:TetR/AcrR family transcriptional regulator [Lachnospiraceae bacterium]